MIGYEHDSSSLTCGMVQTAKRLQLVPLNPFATLDSNTAKPLYVCVGMSARIKT